ncbi:MAG: hypothetical protein JSV43_05580 [Methanobacteriota archaeon]|nr:MAG: hypothetical protein JSV43_05580 [Euryarchaeota archaeon]
MNGSTFYLLSAIIQATAISFGLLIAIHDFVLSRALAQHKWMLDMGLMTYEEYEVKNTEMQWSDRLPIGFVIATIMSTATIISGLISLWNSAIPAEIVLWLAILTFFILGILTLLIFVGPIKTYFMKRKFFKALLQRRSTQRPKNNNAKQLIPDSEE